MSGPLRTQKLSCWQNVDFSETFIFFTQPASGSTDVTNLVPWDFTGCTARMSVRTTQDPGATLLQSLSSGSGLTFVAGTFTPGPATPSVNNGIKIVITKAQSVAMNGGSPLGGAYYDLQVDQPGGTTLLLMAGQFDLLGTVAR